MPAIRVVSLALVSILGGPALPTAALAQSVFFTGPSNQINVADFASRTASPVVVSNGSSFQGLAVREDDLLIVANASQGGELLACDPATGGCAAIIVLEQAEGVDIAPDGTLFAVNGSPGGSDRVVAVLPRSACPEGIDQNSACLPGGYDRASGAVDIDADVGSLGGTRVELLADVKFVPFEEGPFSLGGIAVLVEDPPLLLFYHEPPDAGPHGGAGVDSPWQDCAGQCTPEVVLTVDDFAGHEPRGFDFAPDNSLLITTKSGAVLRFAPDGSPLPLFAQLPGSGEKIAVGVDDVDGDPTIRAFVAVHNNGILQRYDFGSAEPPAQINEGVNAPNGIAISTASSFAATPAGQNVTVSAGGLITTWEQVSAPGTSLVLCTNVTDPRPDNVLSPLNLCDADVDPACTLTGPHAVDLGLEAIIPAYARAYRKLVPGDDPTDPAFPSDPAFLDGPPPQGDDPGPSGPRTFRICRAGTTARFSGLIFDVAQEGIYLGYDPAHPGGDPDLFACDQGPRFFYGTLAGEAPIAETPLMIDISLTCGFNVAGFIQRSVLLPNAIDLRALDGAGDVASAAGCGLDDGVLDCKLAILEQAFASGGKCTDNPEGARARTALARAIRTFDRGDYARAQEELCAFEELVESNGSSFAGCEPRLRDRLRARSRSASYVLGLLNGTVNFSCLGP